MGIEPQTFYGCLPVPFILHSQDSQHCDIDVTNGETTARPNPPHLVLRTPPMPTPSLRVFAISLGCPKNRVDTEHALGFSPQVTIVDSPDDAHWIFINTCGFIAPAVQESVQTIMEYVNLKAEAANTPKLIIAGCLVGRYGAEALAPELPEVDLFLDAKTVENWRAALTTLYNKEAALQNSEAFTRQDSPLPYPQPANQTADQSAGQTAPQTSHQVAPNTPQASPQHCNQASSHGTDEDSDLLVLPTKTTPLAPTLEPIPRVLSTPPSYAWLKISEGCRHSCAFCTIPSIRGKLRSTPQTELIHEASFLLEQGRKELILVAQDVTAWGKDKNTRLEYLLEKLFMLPGLERLRLMYLYPAGLNDDLLSFLQQAGKPFVPYFDMPLQHASANVLQRMGRPFAGNPRKTIDKIRHYFPEAALRTTLITGFPGETDADFEELVEFVEEVRFHHVGVFSYYAEEGTKAATMPEQIEQRIKDYRRDTIMENQETISEEILQGYLGTIQDIIVDATHAEWPGLHVGRTWFQAPDVDGVTYISGRDVTPGAVVKAEVTDTDVYDLSALSVKGA